MSALTTSTMSPETALMDASYVLNTGMRVSLRRNEANQPYLALIGGINIELDEAFEIGRKVLKCAMRCEEMSDQIMIFVDYMRDGALDFCGGRLTEDMTYEEFVSLIAW